MYLTCDKSDKKPLAPTNSGHSQRCVGIPINSILTGCIVSDNSILKRMNFWLTKATTTYARQMRSIRFCSPCVTRGSSAWWIGASNRSSVSQESERRRLQLSRHTLCSVPQERRSVPAALQKQRIRLLSGKQPSQESAMLQHRGSVKYLMLHFLSFPSFHFLPIWRKFTKNTRRFFPLRSFSF